MLEYIWAHIFTINNIIIYLVIINLLGFLFMYVDKIKAKNGRWRIQEKTYFMITILGGGIGTIIGMYTFRHKTKKMYFTVGLPIIVMVEVFLFIYFKFIVL